MSRTVVKYEVTYDESQKSLKMEHTLEGTLEKPSKHDIKVLKKITAIMHDELEHEVGSGLTMSARVDGKLVFARSFVITDLM